MKNLVLALFLACLSARSVGQPTDPFGMDQGEAGDQEAFQAWLNDPATAPPHPLMWLRAVDRSKPSQRKGYFAFFDRQTGLKGKLAETVHTMADDLFALDSYLAEPYPTDGQKRDIAIAKERISKAAEYLFRWVPRNRRVRIYKVAEKFEGARLLLMDFNRLQQTEISDQWMNELQEAENRAGKGYLYGMLKDKDEKTKARIIADYKATIEYLLSFSKPPDTVKGATAKKKFSAAQKKRRAVILKKTKLFGF